MRTPSTSPSANQRATSAWVASNTAGSSWRRPGQRGDREEPPVAAQSVAPADQPVVLPVVHLAPASRYRCPARSGRPDRRAAACRRRRSGRSTSSSEPEHRQHDSAVWGRASSRCRSRTRTRDARPCVSTSHHHGFCAGVARRRRGWARYRRSAPARAAVAAADSRARPSGPPSSADTVVGIGDVVAVRRSRRSRSGSGTGTDARRRDRRGSRRSFSASAKVNASPRSCRR